MAYAQILQRLLQRFFVTMGRAPLTPNEWSKLRRQAMELARKEEGIPSVTKNTTLQDLMTGPHMSDGPKGQRIWDFSKDLPTRDVLEKSADIIPFPRALKGRNMKAMSQGIEGLMKKGDVRLGEAPKTTPEHLKAKKDRGILLRDADEDILRIKRENKEAIDRFRRKMNPDEPDKFYAGGLAPLVGEPSYAADFYDDRTPMEEGGSIWKDLLTLHPFLTTPQDVEYLTPLFQQLRKDKKIDIRKLGDIYEQIEMDKDMRDPENVPPRGERYAAQGGRIGMAGGGALKKFIEALFIKASNDIRQGKGIWKKLNMQQKIVQHDNLTKKVTEFQKTGKLPEGMEEYFGVDVLQAFEGASKKAKRLGKKGPHWKEQEVQAQMDEAAQGGVDMLDERGMLKQKYPGIADELVEKILIDNNPQRKADVTTTIDQYMKLKELGKSEAEAYDIITKSFDKKIPTKHGEGGRISNQSGGPVDHDALVQMYIAEGLSYEEAVQAAQSATNLPWDTLKKAEGGRAEFIFGGSAGLRALLKRLKGDRKRIFPSPPQGIKRFMGKGDTDYIDTLKLQQLETILKAAKIDKDMIAQIRRW